MRMWMVPPSRMCRLHLLGEHGELHKFMTNWKLRYSITGRIESNSIEPLSYRDRHDELAAEMLRRGMNHESPLEQPDFSYLPEHELHAKVDRVASLAMLIDRCAVCRMMNEGCQ